MSALKILKPLIGQWSTRNLHASNSLHEASIIDGKAIADQVLQEVKLNINEWINAGNKRPKLIAVLVGDNPASKAYVGNKVKAAKEVGIESETLKFEKNISEAELLDHINKLNENPCVDGLLVQLPVPEHISETKVCQAVLPEKDVDGFHLENMGRLSLNHRGIIPATALGVKELIIRSNISTFGKSAVVIGRSKHVGLPIALLLHSDGKGEISGLDMTTTICHRYTPKDELTRYTKQADIVVSCAGIPGLINKLMIKPGACIIDVGISRIKTEGGKSKLVGDVDYESVKTVAGYITPVPGGVGPMTVAMLMKNTFFAAQMRKNDELKLKNYSTAS